MLACAFQTNRAGPKVVFANITLGPSAWPPECVCKQSGEAVVANAHAK